MDNDTSPTPKQNIQAGVEETGFMRSTQKITAYVIIFSAVLFALISILAIWGVISEGDAIGRSLSTLAVVVFSAIVVNVGARIYENKF